MIRQKKFLLIQLSFLLILLDLLNQYQSPNLVKINQLKTFSNNMALGR